MHASTAILLMGLFAACSSAPATPNSGADSGGTPVQPAASGPTPPTGTKVTGNITYRQRIALPPDAVISVQLVDVSLADAPALVLAAQEFSSGGKQVPFAFALPYDQAAIQQNHTYAVEARITVGGQLRFISTSSNQVITRGNPTEVEIVLDGV